MTKSDVRIIDILNEKERELLEDYKLGISLARTPIGIRINRTRADKLLRRAKARYLSSQERSHISQ